MTWICPRCRADYATNIEHCTSDNSLLVENLAGTTIADRYTIEKLIGIGGMRSTIWRARQRSTDRPVAIKILPSARSEEAHRFERGARIASNLNHPHITTIHDYGRTPSGAFYLVMELLQGQTLRQMMRQQQLNLRNVFVMIDQVLRGLEHAHAANVVHRDLKPDNLFVTQKNDDIYFIKILDFGLAKLASPTSEYESGVSDDIDGDADADQDPRAGLGESLAGINDVTQAQRICGTPEYMAPEQIVGGPIDRRTDIYALGVILYRMLTGDLPFRARARHELYRQHLSLEPPAIEVTANAPEALVRVVMKALAKRPEDRFADASEMRVAIRAAHRLVAGEFGPSWAGAFASDNSDAKPPPMTLASVASERSARPRRSWLLPAVAIGMFALGGLALALALGGSGDDETDDLAVEPTAQALAAAPGAGGTASPAARDAASGPGAVMVSAGSSDDDAEAAPAAGDAAGAGASEPEETEPEPSTATLAVITSPAGASIRAGGEELGTSPAEVELPPGQHRIDLALEGYEKRSADVALVAGVTMKLELELEPEEPSAEAEPDPSGGEEAVVPPAADAPKWRPARRPARPAPARPAPAPEPPDERPAILGVDIGTPSASEGEVKVLGRDVVDEVPKVKVLGIDDPAAGDQK